VDFRAQMSGKTGSVLDGEAIGDGAILTPIGSRRNRRA
jgi:hypothetical protein